MTTCAAETKSTMTALAVGWRGFPSLRVNCKKRRRRRRSSSSPSSADGAARREAAADISCTEGGGGGEDGGGTGGGLADGRWHLAQITGNLCRQRQWAKSSGALYRDTLMKTPDEAQDEALDRPPASRSSVGRPGRKF